MISLSLTQSTNINPFCDIQPPNMVIRTRADVYDRWLEVCPTKDRRRVEINQEYKKGLKTLRINISMYRIWRNKGRVEIIELLNFQNIFNRSIVRVLNAAYKYEGLVTYARFLIKKTVNLNYSLLKLVFTIDNK